MMVEGDGFLMPERKQDFCHCELCRGRLSVFLSSFVGYQPADDCIENAQMLWFVVGEVFVSAAALGEIAELYWMQC